jgi:ribose 1,5-bisphosphokinase
MSRHLIYVMGPSGVGKDSVLAWLQAHAPQRPAVHFARRCVTRPASAGGEAHEALDTEAFETELRAGAFALHWQANGLRYGVRHEELAPLARREWVLVNGSRGYLPQARSAFPQMRELHITAQAHTLRQRLLARGRETPAEVEARLQRARAFEPPPGAHCVANDGSLPAAGEAVLRLLERLDAEPRALA